MHAAVVADERAPPASDLAYTAPEVVSAMLKWGKHSDSGGAADVWAIGVIALDVILTCSKISSYNAVVTQNRVKTALQRGRRLPWELRPSHPDYPEWMSSDDDDIWLSAEMKKSVLSGCLRREPTDRLSVEELERVWTGEMRRMTPRVADYAE